MTSEYDALVTLRYDVSVVEKRAEAAHGRVDAFVGRLHSLEEQQTKLTRIVSDVLAHSQTLQTELLRSLHATEESLAALRRTTDVMAEQQGRLLREVAELSSE